MFREILDPIIQLFSAIILSGVATTIATQILKMNFIPIPADRYPRLSAGVVAVIASLVAIYNSSLELVLTNWVEVSAFAVGVFIVSAMVYNHIVKTDENSTTTL